MATICAPDTSRPRIAAVGTWDGVHAGHRHILSRLTELARTHRLTPSVVTFPAHPLAIVRPERVPALICSVPERVRRLESEGVEDVILLHFDEALRSMTAEGFMAMLRRDYRVEAILLGFNNSFGSDRLSSHELYVETGKRVGVKVFEAPEWREGDTPVSSSMIRRLVSAGDVGAAAVVLGHPVSVEGTVSPGKQLGRTIGFPTANILPTPGRLIPGNGVYAADAYSPTFDGRRRAIVNIGTRPTVDGPGAGVTIEAHLLDFYGDLYGAALRLDFLCRLRGEQQFPSLDALCAQLRNDASAARLL